MSFLSSFSSFFKNLFTSAPSWTKNVQNVITLVKPLLITVVGMTAGSTDATAVNAVMTEVSADLDLLGTLCAQAKSDGSTKDKVIAVLGSIVANLNGLLSAGHIKNTATLNKINVTVETVIGEVEAVISVLQN